MSATGRAGALVALPGLEREVGRHPEDFYRTPAYAVDAILPYLREPRTWLDAGCGDGAIAGRVKARWPGARGQGIELDEGRARAARAATGLHVWRDDFLRRGALWEERVDLVIGNPPFVQALDFARRGLEVGDEVALLLRAGFLEAKRGSERDLFLEANPCDVHVLAKRPRFTGEGGDACTYIWAVWGAGRGSRFVRLRAPEQA